MICLRGRVFILGMVGCCMHDCVNTLCYFLLL